MTYEEIELKQLDSNPWQTRKEYDQDVLLSIMSTSMDNIGIRNAPLVREHPTKKRRYQIASGHGRIAAWKALEKTSIMCRIENLTDAQMIKEVLVENINRSDLNESERFQAIDQYRKELGLKLSDIKRGRGRNGGFFKKLEIETGIPLLTLHYIYDVKHIRDEMVKFNIKFKKEPSQTLIRRTAGLPDEQRISLIQKAMDVGWSSQTVQTVTGVLKKMQPEIRTLILEEKARLPHQVIVALGAIDDTDTQKTALEYIQTHKLNEELALNLIERAKEGPLVTEIMEEISPSQRVLKEFAYILEKVAQWGNNQYQLLTEAGRWEDALEIIEKIEWKIKKIKSIASEVVVEGEPV